MSFTTEKRENYQQQKNWQLKTDYYISHLYVLRKTEVLKWTLEDQIVKTCKIGQN